MFIMNKSREKYPRVVRHHIFLWLCKRVRTITISFWKKFLKRTMRDYSRHENLISQSIPNVRCFAFPEFPRKTTRHKERKSEKERERKGKERGVFFDLLWNKFGARGSPDRGSRSQFNAHKDDIERPAQDEREEDTIRTQVMRISSLSVLRCWDHFWIWERRTPWRPVSTVGSFPKGRVPLRW